MSGSTVFEVVDRSDDGTDAVLTIRWRPEGGDPLFVLLTSGSDGIVLRFGPTIAVSGWPAWLRGMSVFGAEGGSAVVRLDPSSDAASESGVIRALDLRDGRTRTALAIFAAGLGEVLETHCTEPSADEEQAIAVCAGLPDAFARAAGVASSAALLPDLFLPSRLPILVDDVNNGAARQHVRLTYRLPRLAGHWTDGCSLRLFRSEQAFGVEFRALEGDRLPASLRSACVQDDLGPLLRFTIDRAGNGTDFIGNAKAATALRLVRAIVRQASRDVTLGDAATTLAGFSAPHWRHWLAALPDLLATRAANPLGPFKD